MSEQIKDIVNYLLADARVYLRDFPPALRELDNLETALVNEMQARIPKWLPIADAPKDDDTEIYAYWDLSTPNCIKGSLRIVGWCGGTTNKWHDGNDFVRFPPTHYQLLPAPPQEQEK